MEINQHNRDCGSTIGITWRLASEIEVEIENERKQKCKENWEREKKERNQKQ